MRKVLLACGVLAIGVVPLFVAAPAGAAGSHTATVTPSTGLVDGQTVTVTGEGFVEVPAFNNWTITQCSPVVLTAVEITIDMALNDCDITPDRVVVAPADASGHISTPYDVHSSLTTTHGPVTCGQAPNDSAIIIAQVSSGGFTNASAAVTFGGTPPPPPPPTKPSCSHDDHSDHDGWSHHRPYHWRGHNPWGHGDSHEEAHSTWG